MSLDDLQAQLRGTLDQQFAALRQKYEDEIADARRQAVADANATASEPSGTAPSFRARASSEPGRREIAAADAHQDLQRRRRPIAAQTHVKWHSRRV